MFQCNITGQYFDLEKNDTDREGGLRFGYNKRFRAICYWLTKMQYGECKILQNLEVNKNIKGIGMSDASWASICEEKFNYVNTFYHCSPYLNINNDDHVKQYRDLDFIISSDVFEHVDPFPSIQHSFNNLYRMLKKGGFIVFSVPFDYGEHKEHYPNLYDYEIKLENDEYVLYNTTIDNKKERFTNLCFHGGPGSVLELRFFSKSSLTTYLENAGFVDIAFHNNEDDMNRYGICWDNNLSLIITAKKPII
jgi:SAM-dependent methyltransferase